MNAAPDETQPPNQPPRKSRRSLTIALVAGLVVIAATAATATATLTAHSKPAASTSKAFTPLYADGTPATNPTAGTGWTPGPELSPVPYSPPAQFPAGYPKVVPVSSLPDQVRNWYSIGDNKVDHAVAIAPGVWAPLTPGATMQDAIAAGVLDGFCGSIKAYEREYTLGKEHGGACW